MPRRRCYILFVARDDDGNLRKIPLPLRYAYIFVVAAVVGTFTIVGLAGSYTRMLLKAESYNQVRQQRETLREDYNRMARIAHDRTVQVASLGAVANEVSALYGLRQNRIAAGLKDRATETAAGATASASLAQGGDPAGDPAAQQIEQSFNDLNALRTEALSGRISRVLDGGLSPAFTGDWTELADAPSLWPVEGRIGSAFGERQDPFSGEGAFHSGIDIDAPFGTPVRAAGDGLVTSAGRESGYGREITIDHGHGISTLYGHLSAFAVLPGQRVAAGQVIGYVGESGRATGPHLHYEVRIRNIPVNPHPFLRTTYEQFAGLDEGVTGAGGSGADVTGARGQ